MVHTFAEICNQGQSLFFGAAASWVLGTVPPPRQEVAKALVIVQSGHKRLTGSGCSHTQSATGTWWPWDWFFADRDRRDGDDDNLKGTWVLAMVDRL